MGIRKSRMRRWVVETQGEDIRFQEALRRNRPLTTMAISITSSHTLQHPAKWVEEKGEGGHVQLYDRVAMLVENRIRVCVDGVSADRMDEK
jgi:hypothetical protein